MNIQFVHSHEMKLYSDEMSSAQPLSLLSRGLNHHSYVQSVPYRTLFFSKFFLKINLKLNNMLKHCQCTWISNVRHNISAQLDKLRSNADI